MRKNRLLLAVLGGAALTSISSCSFFERKSANDFDGAFEMYEAFFKETYEYDNMKVVMEFDDSFITEYICASTSYSIDSKDGKNTWAFLNKDGWKTVAYKYEKSEQDGLLHSTPEDQYEYSASAYENNYKSFIRYVDYLGSLKETLTKEQVKGLSIEAKKENLGEDNALFTLKIVDPTEKDSKNQFKYELKAESENGLVRTIKSYRNDSNEPSNLEVTIIYSGVKSIEVPDITDWKRI